MGFWFVFEPQSFVILYLDVECMDWFDFVFKCRARAWLVLVFSCDLWIFMVEPVVVPSSGDLGKVLFLFF